MKQKKKILIFVREVSKNKNSLKNIISDFLGGDAEIVMDTFSNVTFEIEEGRVSVKVSGNDIKDYSLVYFRSIDHRFSFLVGAISYYLAKNKIKFVNKRLEYSRAISDKLTSLVILALNGLPVIPTFFCTGEDIGRNVDLIIKKFGFPIVVKETRKHHSKGIFVLRKISDFTKLLRGNSLAKKQFLFQKFIPISEEYRLLVLGRKVRSVQKMYRDLGGFKASIDYKRKEEFTGIKSVTDKMKKMAVAGARALNMQIAGVDILIAGGSGKPVLIEINSSPGFTFDVNISPEIAELSKFLREQIFS